MSTGFDFGRVGVVCTFFGGGRFVGVLRDLRAFVGGGWFRVCLGFYFLFCWVR